MHSRKAGSWVWTLQTRDSPSPGSGQTARLGWSRSAEASKPCSLGCHHLPAFSSYHLWAGRAWAGARAEGNMDLSKNLAWEQRRSGQATEKEPP